MPLINLRTDLKSLKYGKDTPGGGYSGQPYIQAKIPDGLEPKSPDFILRGGYLAPANALEDIKRLGKMFGDLKSPNGLLFIAKQNLLSNSAVRTQTSGILNEGIYTPLSTLAQAGVVAFGGHLNKQGINPFEQTGAYAQGDYLYFNKVKNDNAIGVNRLVSLYTAVSNNTSPKLSGFTLNGNGGPTPVNVLSYNGGPDAPLGVGNTNIRFADQRTGKNSALRVSYPDYFDGKYSTGAPGPVYLHDQTIHNVDFNTKLGLSSIYNRDVNKVISSINQAEQALSLFTGLPASSISPLNLSGFPNNFNVYKQGNTFPETNLEVTQVNNTFVYSQENLIATTINPPAGDHLSPKIQNFREILRASLGFEQSKKASALGATPDTPNYQDKNMTVRVNIGDPGQRANKSYASYTTGVIDSSTGTAVGPLDKINALAIYRSQNVTENPIKNDLVKFRIAAIDGNNPNFKTFIHFRAFIDSFSDSYNASWGDVRYLGRGEKFYNYNGFDRTITLSFTVVAQSKPELIPMYKKLNYLASNLAPDYSPDGYMRGPLVQLTMGGYLYEQPGFITALTYDVPNDTTWEIGINDQGDFDNSVKELPHRISVSSFQFTPIHNFIPSKQGLGDYNLDNQTYTNLNSDASVIDGNKYGPQRFIALSNAESTFEGYSNLNNYDSQ
jgi:hypothetical protein